MSIGFTNSMPSRTASPSPSAAARQGGDEHMEFRPTIGPDRFAMVLGGAALAVCGVTRGTLPGLVAAAIGGYAAYCAAGTCPSHVRELNSTFGGPNLPRPRTDDPVEDASLDSFPASDPPSYSSSRR